MMKSAFEADFIITGETRGATFPASVVLSLESARCG
jgi:hypothetical protein